MRKVIFLDIDGVLNGFPHRPLIEDTFDEEKLNLIISLSNDTDSEIVITSTRRVYESEREMIERVFKSFHKEISFMSEKRTFSSRSDEIIEYLHKNPGTMRFVIIDDNDYDYSRNPILRNRFIQVGYFGFTDEEYKESYKILK